MSKKPRLIEADSSQEAIAIHLVDKASFDAWLKTLSSAQRAAVQAQKFEGAADQLAILPDGDGWCAAAGVADRAKLSSWCLARAAETLPEGTYRCVGAEPGAARFGWICAQYRFENYRKDDKATGARVLLTGEAARIDAISAEAEAECLVRDLVNTPAQDMGPAEIEARIEQLAKEFSASLSVTRGEALEREYPMVHAVGRAAERARAPRLIHLSWGKKKAPVLGIVGKGVAFDSGGLDIKSAAGMQLMKKDMGGAAHAIALARLVMLHGLDVRLHLIVPAVENAVSGNAFRPGDVLRSRKGLSVEIGNTDAEGRLILGDALTRASEENPDLIIDFATLTGAARVALGPDLPALMARRDETAEALIAAGKACDDEVWRLPLPGAYAEWLKSDIADLNNIASNPYAGASVAGLFLDRFVGDGIDWAHFDTFAWRPFAKPGRPRGGAAYGLRASWHMIKQRFEGCA